MARSTRRLFLIGGATVPESPVLLRGKTGDGAEETRACDHDHPQAARHPAISALVRVAAATGRLFYGGSATDFSEAPAGTLAGLYALQHAAFGSATQGMDPALRHVASLDHCFPGDVAVRRVAAGARSGVVLLTTGVMVALSRDPSVHGTVVQLPVSALDPATGSPARVLDVAAGETHFVCCDDHGRVYTWGWGNEFGQLGNGSMWPRNDTAADAHEPRRLEGFGIDDVSPDNAAARERCFSVLAQTPAPSVRAVACGWHHTLLLTVRTDTVFAFGRNDRGQLGLGNGAAGEACRLSGCPTPRAVRAVVGVPVEQIAAAPDGHHSLLVLRTGRVVGFGDNTTGTLGTATPAAVSQPTPAAFLSSVSSPSPPPVSEAVDQSRGDVGATRPPPATYGTLQSALHPRRVRSLASDRAAGEPRVLQASTSATHTVLAAEPAETTEETCSITAVLSSGLRPVRGPPDSITHADALGCLGRPVRSSSDALHFGAMVLRATRPCGGRPIMLRVAAAIAGTGFTALWDAAEGTVAIHGAVTLDGQVCIGSGLRVRQPAGTTADEPSADGWDDCAAVQVNVGPTGRVVGVHAAGGALLLLVESDS